MKKYITRANIGLLCAVAMGGYLMIGGFAKLIQAEEVVRNLENGGLYDWTLIIGIGEVVSIILFIIPQTMRLGAMLLAAYFGGVIMFHMSHSMPEHQGFTAGAVFFTLTLVISWIRGMELITVGKEK